MHISIHFLYFLYISILLATLLAFRMCDCAVRILLPGSCPGPGWGADSWLWQGSDLIGTTWDNGWRCHGEVVSITDIMCITTSLWRMTMGRYESKMNERVRPWRNTRPLLVRSSQKNVQTAEQAAIDKIGSHPPWKERCQWSSTESFGQVWLWVRKMSCDDTVYDVVMLWCYVFDCSRRAIQKCLFASLGYAPVLVALTVMDWVSWFENRRFSISFSMRWKMWKLCNSWLPHLDGFVCFYVSTRFEGSEFGGDTWG